MEEKNYSGHVKIDKKDDDQFELSILGNNGDWAKAYLTKASFEDFARCAESILTGGTADLYYQNKHDFGKPRMDLIPPSSMTSLAKVLTYGANKYKENSWKCVDRERYVGAILRHLVLYMDDPYGTDYESGLYHIEHVLCNAAFLNDMTVNKELYLKDKDER